MAAGSTYTPIATTTLGSAATVTFSSIPSTYTDIKLVIIGGTTRATTSDVLFIRLNGDTGTNYSDTSLAGTGSAAVSQRSTSTTSLFDDSYVRLVGTTYGLNSTMFIDFMNYANTTTYKTALLRCGAAETSPPGTSAAVGLWRSTSAITSISLAGQTISNFAVGSTFTLYGIAAA